MNSIKKTIVGIVIMSAIAISLGICNYVFYDEDTPVHRTNIEGTDPIGDVSNSDIDIVEYRSYKSSEERPDNIPTPYFVVIEMTVSGTIDEECQYWFVVVARKTSDQEGHIYEFLYEDGACAENLDVEIEGATMRMYFPISRLRSDDYMTGIELGARLIYDNDRTLRQRNATIEYQ